jgi:hypothetical protein
VTVSQLDSKSTRPAGILIRKPKSNAYTGLLGIAVVAMAIACLLLYLEMTRYGGIAWFIKAAWKPVL